MNFQRKGYIWNFRKSRKSLNPGRNIPREYFLGSTLCHGPVPNQTPRSLVHEHWVQPKQMGWAHGPTRRMTSSSSGVGRRRLDGTAARYRNRRAPMLRLATRHTVGTKMSNSSPRTCRQHSPRPAHRRRPTRGRWNTHDSDGQKGNEDSCCYEADGPSPGQKIDGTSSVMETAATGFGYSTNPPKTCPFLPTNARTTNRGTPQSTTTG